MGALVLRDVSRTFGGVRAVDGVSLTAPAGRVTGLIGPNGAGKSTLVNLISGFLKLSRGQVFLDDREVTYAEAPQLARAGIARTFQNIRLIPSASTLDNVLAGMHRHEHTGMLSNLFNLPSARRERRELEQNALTLLDRLGMGTYAHSPAGDLSYGHQRRLEIARALASKPTVLLLDEPVAGMNDQEAFALGELVTAVAGESVAILLIEHNIRFVRAFCEFTYVVASGRMIAEGGRDTVFSDQAVINAYLGE